MRVQNRAFVQTSLVSGLCVSVNAEAKLIWVLVSLILVFNGFEISSHPYDADTSGTLHLLISSIWDYPCS